MRKDVYYAKTFDKIRHEDLLEMLSNLDTKYNNREHILSTDRLNTDKK